MEINITATQIFQPSCFNEGSKDKERKKKKE